MYQSPNPHPIENIMKASMEEIRKMVDVDTIVGEPMYTSDGTMIVPVSKVSLGFMSGGGEYTTGQKLTKKNQNNESVDEINHPFAGTSVAGMSVAPMTFLIVKDGHVKVIPALYDNTIDRLIELVPRTIDEIASLIENRKQKNDEEMPYTQN